MCYNKYNEIILREPGLSAAHKLTPLQLAGPEVNEGAELEGLGVSLCQI